jgi:ABC-2 type transport system permease protein
MTATSDTFPREAPAAAAPMAKTRPFFWSVRRELWENRAIYLAAPIAACVAILGDLFGHMVARGAVILQPDGPRPWEMPAALPYGFAALVITAASCIVGVFYCLGALNGERRDRSVLFWKSLPVSDLTTVLSKAVVPAVIMPTVTFATIFVTSLVMLALDFGFAAARGTSVPDVLGHLPLLQIWLDLAYAMVVLAAWWAPIWSWLLLVSAWAKRMTFLWAAGPPLAVCVFEQMSLRTDYAWRLLNARIAHGLELGFTTPPSGNPVALPWPDPLPLLASPGLWIGLVLAVTFLAGAVWLRRRQEPV